MGEPRTSGHVMDLPCDVTALRTACGLPLDRCAGSIGGPPTCERCLERWHAEPDLRARHGHPDAAAPLEDPEQESTP